MQSIDASQGWKSANSQVESIKTFKEVSKSLKDLKKSAGDSLAKSTNSIATQLDKLSEQQKRYLKNGPTSMDNILNLFVSTKGQGTQTFKYLRKKLLETTVKVEPEIKNILNEQTLKVVGCSQEQTYSGVDSALLEIEPLPLRPNSTGIYIPVQSLDLSNTLKTSVDSKLGKIFYEKLEPSVNPKFKSYGGSEPYPMNKELNLRMNKKNESFFTQYGTNYKGSSQQDLFDIQYTTVNQYNITGNYYRVVLIDRQGQTSGLTSNNVGEFLRDYYSTIKLVDSVDITSQLMNILSNVTTIKAELGSNEITNQSKFYLLAARILGLCFDSRTEIDVSGVSKVAELDGVDETFFEFTDTDLRNIDINITNAQNKVIEFEDCNNVKVPVDYETIINELDNFRATLDEQSNEQQVETIEKIIDTLSENPDWKLYLPTNFNASLTINKNLLKQLPVAVASAVLSPKVLLPIYIMLSVVESEATNTYNQTITSANTYIQSANTFIQSGNTIAGKVNNLVGNSVDFMKKFKQFTIEVISKIGEIYLRTLFELLKKDIINLLSSVISDITKSKKTRKYLLILRLVGIATAVAQLIGDYRKCKNLLDDILSILKLINGLSGPADKLPLPLLLLSEFLPGYSPERATINVIKELQSLGVPTGVLPDGSPNLMLLYNFASNKGNDDEEINNGSGTGVSLGVNGVSKVIWKRS